MEAESIVKVVLGTIFKVVVAVIVIVLVYKYAIKSYDYGYRIFTEPAFSQGPGKTVTVAVTEDMSPWAIGDMFEEKGLVGDGKLFALQYMFSEYNEDVKPGVFDLNSSMTAEEMMAEMAGGEELIPLTTGE